MNPALSGVWTGGFYLPPLPAAPRGVRAAPGAPEVSTGWASSSASLPRHSPGMFCPFIHPVGKALGMGGCRGSQQLSAGSTWLQLLAPGTNIWGERMPGEHMAKTPKPLPDTQNPTGLELLPIYRERFFYCSQILLPGLC